jgi:hypothetical protein
MLKFSDSKPSADIAYLSSAITKEALTNKFQDLFGRDPVYEDPDSPMKVTDTRVPTMISNTVDPQIATMLRASAVEDTPNASGEIEDVDNATLLYTLKDTEPAQISLEAISEYKELDSSAVDSTLSAISETDEINIEQGVAYLSPQESTIQIGIFVDNTDFAEEFQYRLENSGGDELSPEEKESVFTSLYEDLPGGDNVLVEGVRTDLLKVVGLTSALSEDQQAEGNEAPGPEPVVEEPEK